MTSDWHFGINDPDPVGWIIFTAYLVTAALCWTNVWRRSRTDFLGERLMWPCLALLMLVFGINKQLDIQTPFVDLVRSCALDAGWYDQRRILKWVFVLGVGVAGFGILGWTVSLARRCWRRYALPLCGVACLIAFVMTEAAPTQHHGKRTIPESSFDRMQFMEVAGIACIAVSAMLNLRRQKAARAPGLSR
jgi:4-amino-4-deoxy-L-arabinose transferase-like glycosyltransferase